MARRYNRDSRGRFASGGGGGSKRPAARGISRGTNRLTRDNSGRITSVGGDGATARGGRLRTASGKQRATQTARISGAKAAGTVTRSGARRTAAAAAVKAKPEAVKGRTIGHTEAYQRRSEAQLKRGIETGRRAQQYLADKGAVQAPLGSRLSLAHGKAQRVEWGSRNAFNARANHRLNTDRKSWERPTTTRTKPTTRAAAAAAKPRQPKMSEILGGTLRTLAQADARRIREVESITGQKLRVPSSTTTRATTAAPRTGRVTDALGSSLRRLAQSDARMARGMADIASAATPKLAGTKASKPALKPAKPTTRAAAAAAKPVRRGLTGKGKAPSTRLPSANSDQYKYNKAGLIATPQERSRMRGRDRAREKNAALAQQQAAGRLRAERRAARRMTSTSAEPGSVSRYSSTFNAAERALRRRSQRADSNFADSVKLERSKAQLTAKAVKMQNQAAQRKAEGKPITKTMESNFQKLRRDIAKIDRSLQTRRRALEVTGSASQRMEINTRNRR